MSALPSLWLPILLSAVVVFIISSLVHMVFKWHAFDYKGFYDEEAVRGALGGEKVQTGIKYVVPYCEDMKQMGSEEMQRKYQEGPNAVIVFGPNGRPNMGKYLGQWFLWSLVVAFIAAFITSRLIPHDAGLALSAAKLSGAITFIAHGFGSVQESIWMYRSWRSTATYLLDGLLYGLGTAAVFYWLW